jgi:hypothetical protein
MKIIRNEKKIKRNARIAQFAMISGLVVLAGGMFISFRYPEQFSISLLALILGFILSQVGIYFTNRWGRRPRPDEVLDQGLKGLDNKYTLYHYSTPVSHLLVGPAGVWVLIPYHQRGTITYSKGRWRQRGGNLYLKIFAQEGLGRPDLEVIGDIENLQKFLSKNLPEESLPPIEAALVFTNPSAEISISEDEEPPAETLPVAKLKDLIRKSAKSTRFAQDDAQLLLDAFGTQET